MYAMFLLIFMRFHLIETVKILYSITCAIVDVKFVHFIIDQKNPK